MHRNMRFFLTALCLFSFFPSTNSKTSVSSIKQAVRQEANETYKGELVFSYESVAEYYFDKYNESHPEKMKSVSDFILEYRNQENNLAVYCGRFAVQSSSTKSKEVENYILGVNIGDENYTETSFFKAKPIMQAYDYSVVQDGDIIYEAEADDPKHVAFVYDPNHKSGYGNYVQTIEAVPDKVQFGFLDDDRIIRKGVSVYRVYRALELNVVSRAKEFIRKQVGKNYSMDFTKTDTSEDETEWYCSELVFAAYWAGGVNIGNTANYKFDPTTTFITPEMITWGMLNRHIALSDSYVDISISAYSSSTWSINVYNPNSYSVDLEYNKKMCFEDDAKNWSKLKDLVKVQLGSHCVTTVDIKENFFATTIVFGYLNKDDNYRYITYANELTKGGYTMSVRYIKK